MSIYRMTIATLIVKATATGDSSYPDIVSYHTYQSIEAPCRAMQGARRGRTFVAVLYILVPCSQGSFDAEQPDAGSISGS